MPAFSATCVKGGLRSIQNELIQTWMLHNLQLIGEAARSLASEFREAHPEIPWTAIIGMRTILVHHYFEIDENAVWIAAERDVPPLASAVAAILGADDLG